MQLLPAATSFASLVDYQHTCMHKPECEHFTRVCVFVVWPSLICSESCMLFFQKCESWAMAFSSALRQCSHAPGCAWLMTTQAPGTAAAGARLIQAVGAAVRQEGTSARVAQDIILRHPADDLHAAQFMSATL